VRFSAEETDDVLVDLQTREGYVIALATIVSVVKASEHTRFLEAQNG
jgi:hypothetical protein